MKKFAVVVWLILSFIIIYLLQVNFFSWFNLASVKPNLFVILVLTIGVFAGKGIGTTFGILFGIALDFFIGKSIGISALMLGIIGFVGGYLDKSFSKDSRVTMITMIVMSTFIYELGAYIFNYFINSAQISIWYFAKILIIELVYNTIITIIIYPLIMKFGYKIEENFKETKILTRYF